MGLLGNHKNPNEIRNRLNEITEELERIRAEKEDISKRVEETTEKIRTLNIEKSKISKAILELSGKVPEKKSPFVEASTKEERKKLREYQDKYNKLAKLVLRYMRELGELKRSLGKLEEREKKLEKEGNKLTNELLKTLT